MDRRSFLSSASVLGAGAALTHSGHLVTAEPSAPLAPRVPTLPRTNITVKTRYEPIAPFDADVYTRRLERARQLTRDAGASILLARHNFGCGSSREHAPWALVDYGFRALIAPSYADIFFNNCLKNGLLPIVLSDANVDRLFSDVSAFPGYTLTIDLERQTVATADRALSLGFDIDPFRKRCLLNGWDDIGLTLQHADEIRAFEARHLREQPWL